MTEKMTAEGVSLRELADALRVIEIPDELERAVTDLERRHDAVAEEVRALQQDSSKLSDEVDRFCCAMDELRGTE